MQFVSHVSSCYLVHYTVMLTLKKLLNEKTFNFTCCERTPTYVDPNKIIVASYSQGNELVFGQNAGQQCVAMSLCSLIYNDTQGISSANDLIQIMNIGNQLYSSLS